MTTILFYAAPWVSLVTLIAAGVLLVFVVKLGRLIVHWHRRVDSIRAAQDIAAKTLDEHGRRLAALERDRRRSLTQQRELEDLERTQQIPRLPPPPFGAQQW